MDGEQQVCERAGMSWQDHLEDGQQPGLGQCWETRLPSSQEFPGVKHGELWAGGEKTSQ